MSTIKNYILDTNVLIHNPQSIFDFEDNNLFIPIYVLQELDGLKTDMSAEKGRNAREAVRIIESLRVSGSLSDGVSISEECGKLFIYVPSWFDNQKQEFPIPYGLTDRDILSTAIEIRNTTELQTIFVTQDVNLRIRADALGLETSSYEHQSVDIDTLGNDVKTIKVSSDRIDTFFAAKGKGSFEFTKEEIEENDLKENNSIILEANDSTKTALGRYIEKTVKPLRVPREGILGIRPKNKEQAFAMDLLLDRNVNLVTLMGIAGGGKTILACCLGLYGVLEGVYDKLLISRPIIPLGRDLGFLPGDAIDKVDPYMKPFYDNLDYIMMAGGLNKKYKTTLDDLFESGKIQIEPLAYIRGRSISNQFIIVDESTNTTPHEVKTIISRCGEGTKIIMTGDIYQIDNPYVDSTSNGLSVVVKKIKDEPEVGHLKLVKGLRSSLANIAVSKL